MKRFEMQQGSEEWRRARMGIPTASAFDRILTPGGKPSKSAEGYMYELLGELMMGRPSENSPKSSWMNRGTTLEEDARNWYEFQMDVAVEMVGFCTTDDGTIGASPDGLVGADGNLELKCPKPETHVRYLLFPDRGVEKEYSVQVQGQLYVTGRKWCDVVSFHPELPRVIVRVERDEEYIDLLDKELKAFCAKLADGKVELERRGLLSIGDRTTETIPDEPEAHDEAF